MRGKTRQPAATQKNTGATSAEPAAVRDASRGQMDSNAGRASVEEGATADDALKNTPDGAASIGGSATPGIWSQQTIRRRSLAGRLFSDEAGQSLFDEQRLDPAGYRLAIGAEIYISPGQKKEKASVQRLDVNEAFYIPPGQFAFLLTEEVVKVPHDAFAFIALRTRTKFKGLVNVSGFHADPGYDGRLIFAVFNAGPGDVHLRRGEDLFTISFATLDEVTDNPRSETERFLRIPSSIITPIAGEVQSFAGLKQSIDDVEEELDERLHDMERDVAILKWSFALLLSAFVGLLVRFLTAG